MRNLLLFVLAAGIVLQSATADEAKKPTPSQSVGGVIDSKDGGG